MATQAGEKSTGKRMFWIAVVCPVRTMDSPPWSSRVAAPKGPSNWDWGALIQSR